jgi:hypothetical protein
MSLLIDTDDEMNRYDEAALYAKTVKPDLAPGIRSSFNVGTGQTDLLAPLPSGGFVKLGSQAPEITVEAPDIMVEAPAMPGMGADAALPVEDDEFQLQSIRNFAASGANISSRDDYLAAGYSDQLIDASGVMGETQQKTGRTEPLSVGEIKTILREGGTLLQDYTPTMRENGSADLMETLMELSVDRRREELMAQGVDTAEISRIITSEQPEMRSLAENLTDVVFGNKNVLGTGIADFVTAGVMDMQEGWRMLEAGSSFNGGSATQRGLGILLIAAGVAEATGVGFALGKLIKASIPKIQGALVSMGQNAELRMAERGPAVDFLSSTMMSGVDPTIVTDPLVAAAGRAVDSSKFAIETKDASSVFGEGAVYKTYTDPASGGLIRVVQRKDGSASVLDLEVPEESQGKGIGQALQAAAMEGNTVLTGQVSSKAAATTAYRLGRRPSGQPDATLDEVFAIIDDQSSVNLVSPAAQPNDGIVAKIDPPTDDTPGIIAFHGSAADFDGFKLEKIGTGEGAQMYGYGLYFTDKEEIAKFYKESLTEVPADYQIDGQSVSAMYDQAINNQNYELAEVLEQVQLHDAPKDLKERFTIDGGYSQETQDFVRDLDYDNLTGVNPDGEAIELGRVYKVGLTPKPDDLLDYDLPFNEQTPAIQAALEKAGYKSEYNMVALEDGDGRFGVYETDEAGKRTFVKHFNDGLMGMSAEAQANKYIKEVNATLPKNTGGQILDVLASDLAKKATAPTNTRLDEINIQLRRLAKEMEPFKIPGTSKFNDPKGDALSAEYGALMTERADLPKFKRKDARRLASDALEEAGIPGIKYRDGASRGDDIEDAAADRNYVIFDDSMIKILEKYGIVGPVAISAMALSEDET